MAQDDLVERLRQAVKKPAKAFVKDWVLWRELPAIYREASSAPIDARKIIFIEDKSLEMPDAFSVIFPYLQDNFDLDVSFVGLGKTSGKGWRSYYAACRELVREVATARAVFLADASDIISCLPLREGTDVVQLWHACGAFKKWGMGTAELKFGGSRSEITRHPGYGNLSLVTVSSSEVEWAYREAMALEDVPETVRALGVSRTDTFFDPAFLAEARRAVEELMPAARGKRIVLYAPTFRGHVHDAMGPDALDIPLMRHILGDDHVLLVKHHPFVKKPPTIPGQCRDFAFDVGDRLATPVLLAVADALVTDYSSVAFEYSLFNRPMAFFAYDLDDYNDWRGFFYDYDEMTPGPVVTQTVELAGWLRDVADGGFDDAEVAAFRERFMRACDGHATERIVGKLGLSKSTR